MRYLTKTGLICLGLLATGGAMADGFNGPYLGLGLSNGFLSFYHSQAYTPAEDTAPDVVIQSSQMANFFAGYGFTIENTLYLGTELGFMTNTGTAKDSFSEPTTDNAQDTNTYNLKLENQFRAGVLAGIVLGQNILVYSRVDGLIATMKYNANETISNSSQSVTLWSINNSTTVPGVGIGLGAEFQANNHLSARIETELEMYNSITNNATGSYNNQSVSALARANMLSVTAAGIYTF